jgi:methylglutaconyl-CoA hydratase
MSTQLKTVQLTVSDRGVAQVEMARPKVYNALDETMIGELDETFGALAADPQVRVIVLSGQGRAFSAGADLAWMQRAANASQEWNLADARGFSGLFQRIHESPKPTIARVHGLALGAGVGLACACDIAIAASDAKLAVSETRFGILPAVIGPYLVNAVGVRQAQRLALTASRIGAEEALRIGLVHQVVEPDKLDVAIAATVAELCLGGPQAQAEIKHLYSQLRPGKITPATRELCAQTISRVRGTGEAREGFAAFLAKRPASWAGTP